MWPPASWKRRGPRATQVRGALDVESGSRRKHAEVAGRVDGHGEGSERGRAWRGLEKSNGPGAEAEVTGVNDGLGVVEGHGTRDTLGVTQVLGLASDLLVHGDGDLAGAGVLASSEGPVVVRVEAPAVTLLTWPLRRRSRSGPLF